MKVRMKTTLAGPGGNASVGDIVDLPKGEAYALIEGGYAEQPGSQAALPLDRESETAEAPQPETTAKGRRPRRRGRAKPMPADDGA